MYTQTFTHLHTLTYTHIHTLTHIVIEFGALKAFRLRILKHVTGTQGLVVGSGKTVRTIVENLWSMVNNNIPRVHIDDLAACLQSELGFRLMMDEKRAIITTFSDSGQFVSLPEMTDFIRGSIAARSQVRIWVEMIGVCVYVYVCVHRYVYTLPYALAHTH